MGKLQDKVAIITGATSGMGRAIAERFAAEGARVVVGGRNEARGQDVVSTIRTRGGIATFVASDISTLEGNRVLVEAALRSYGQLNLLVPNAGILGVGSVTEVSIDTWHQTIATNLSAVFYLCRLGLPHLQEQGQGAVVVNGSIAAHKAFPNHPAYCASKGALVGLVRQMALDYGKAVRINLLCPGPVDTPLLWDSAKAFPDPDAAVEGAAQATVLKRLGTPEDVANAALFLASSDASWITGSSLTIDGGILCG